LLVASMEESLEFLASDRSALPASEYERDWKSLSP